MKPPHRSPNASSFLGALGAPALPLAPDPVVANRSNTGVAVDVVGFVAPPAALPQTLVASNVLAFCWAFGGTGAPHTFADWATANGC